MNKFNELSHRSETQRTIEDFSFEELRTEKLSFYDEMKEFFDKDFFSDPESDLGEFLQQLADMDQKNDATEYLSKIAALIEKQIEKLRSDETPDQEQTETIESLELEQRRVNRFLIALDYFH